MTKEQMEKTLKDVDLLEKDLMRDLTEEESTLVCEQGFKALFDKLEFDDEDFKTLRALRQLISTFCTKSIDDYEAELKKNNYAAADVLETILNDLRACASAEQHDEKIGSVKDLGTKIKLNSNSAKTIDHGYLESEDPDLDSYFSKESTDEAREAIGVYDPEKDEDLFKEYSDSKLDTYKSKMEKMLGSSRYLPGCTCAFECKDSCSTSQENPGYSIPGLIDSFKSGNVEFIDLTEKEAEEVREYLSDHFTNYSYQNVNGRVTIKFF